MPPSLRLAILSDIYCDDGGSLLGLQGTPKYARRLQFEPFGEFDLKQYPAIHHRRYQKRHLFHLERIFLIVHQYYRFYSRQRCHNLNAP